MMRGMPETTKKTTTRRPRRPAAPVSSSLPVVDAAAPDAPDGTAVTDAETGDSQVVGTEAIAGDATADDGSDEDVTAAAAADSDAATAGGDATVGAADEDETDVATEPAEPEHRTLLQRVEALHVPIWSGANQGHICGGCGQAMTPCRTVRAARSGKPEAEVQADILSIHRSTGLPGRPANCAECLDVRPFPCPTTTALTGELPAAPAPQPAPKPTGDGAGAETQGTAAPW